jgi:hypothetical protein
VLCPSQNPSQIGQNVTAQYKKYHLGLDHLCDASSKPTLVQSSS